MPPYVWFLQGLYTTNRAVNVLKRRFLASNVRSIISNQVPLKHKDPRRPMISTAIGDHNIHRTLLDLGTTVNLLPFPTCEKLGLGKLNPQIWSFNWSVIQLGFLERLLRMCWSKLGNLYFWLTLYARDRGCSQSWNEILVTPWYSKCSH